MLLLHQTGSVKIGEVVRYTVTYTPSADRILPSPEFLFLQVKNTCNIALRAAFVHAPYNLYVAAYPSHFDPQVKFENPRRYGVPEFEPMLKPGGTWSCHLVVPDNIRQTAGEGSSRHGAFGNGPEHEGESVTWIIEVASQVLFSTSAAVHYDIMLARDEKSLSLGSVMPVIGNQNQVPEPGHVSDFQQSAGAAQRHPAQPRGVFSRAIQLKVQDTAALWNTPELPGWDDMGWLRARTGGADAPVEAAEGHSQAAPDGGQGEPCQQPPRTPSAKQKKVHLVVLTHGLHSNLGADMLFLKESIDAGARQAKIDARARKARERAARKRARSSSIAGTERITTENQEAGTERDDDGGDENDSDDDDEEVVVRGFSGNATKTNRGIKYLGKRLAKYILSMTYPDQPCLPTAKAASEAIAHTLKTSAQKKAIEEAHRTIAAHHAAMSRGARTYKFTKISFVGHSLGGLVQTYAIAYLQKTSPQFFDLIKPINFIALASPFLGLNHENPMYVKFALDLGLVGRTGQDLGLTWRAPTIARNGWGAIVSNLGENAHKRVYGEPQPESKPLLRILPTGPAHTALKKFRNRTAYSNVVNDGIVPLRTSCLLFLDWQGLERVEKARREAGLVETVVGFGWAELTGASVTTPRIGPWSPPDEDESTNQGEDKDSHQVPQPSIDAILEDDRQSLRSFANQPEQQPPRRRPTESQQVQSSGTTTNNPFAGILNFFRVNTGEPPKSPKPPPSPRPKVSKIYHRSQTLKSTDSQSTSSSASLSVAKVTAGEFTDDAEGLSAPPKTSIFESAGDLLNPKLPPVEFLIDPSKRPRTIFHDRVYHPPDIPPPPLKPRSTSPLTLRRRSFSRSPSNSSSAAAAAARSKSPTPSPLPSPSLGPRKDTFASLASAATASSTQSAAWSQTPQQTPRINSADYESTIHSSLDKDSQTPMVPTSDGASRPSEEDQPSFETVQQRVEEKIARAYHRGMSWRKVLVKLEPDAHNNIIVRRMFSNAFGWPVVEHLVEAHFSDSASARTRVDEEEGTTLCFGNSHTNTGLSTTSDSGAAGRGRKTDTKNIPIRVARNRPGAVDGEDADADDDEDEERDEVPELPRTPSLAPSAPGSGSAGRGSLEATTTGTTNALGLGYFALSSPTPVSPRPRLARQDSVTWSDKDWADSGDESDEVGSGGVHSLAAAVGGGAGSQERNASPLNWNWTEKIVGKGAANRSGSPKPQGRETSTPAGTPAATATPTPATPAAATPTPTPTGEEGSAGFKSPTGNGNGSAGKGRVE